MIAIVVALPSEAKALLEKFQSLSSFLLCDKPSYSGKLFGKDVVLSISGIGKVSAALTTQLLIDKYSPEYVLNFGTCGGVNSNVEVLKYYAIEKCCQYDFDLCDLDGVPLGYIQEYDRVFFPACVDSLDFLPKAVLASADRFTHTEHDVNAVNDIGASICDMEGGAIAQVCLSNSVKLVIIKGISDVHGSGTQQEQFFKNLKTVGAGFPAVIEKAIKSI